MGVCYTKKENENKPNNNEIYQRSKTNDDSYINKSKKKLISIDEDEPVKKYYKSTKIRRNKIKKFGASKEKKHRKSIKDNKIKKEEIFIEEDNNSNSKKINIDVKASMLVSLIKKDPKEDYIIEKKLGEGGYGMVWRVKNKKSKLIRAMKKIKRYSNNIEDFNETKNEIETLKKMDHPNIVKIFDYYMDDDYYYLITEFCENGELYKKIIENKNGFDESSVAYIMYQIFSAVNYCHSTLNIIHRDLKPENILIDSFDKNKNLYNIKIIDFGTAKIYDKNKKEKNIIGSLYYIAPEVLEKNYNEKCDIWSCGVILYILLTGTLPFKGEGLSLLENIKKGSYSLSKPQFDIISCHAKNLIQKCLEKNPEKRISANVALSHKFFEIYNTNLLFSNVSNDKLNEILQNLINYKPKNKLQEISIAYIVHNFQSIDDIKDINKVFMSLNKSNTGKLTKKEMLYGLSKFNFKNKITLKKTVDDLFLNMDNDNNGYIEFEEFQRAGLNKNLLLSDNVLNFIFKFLDKDGSGEISLEELKTVFAIKNDDESIKYLNNIMNTIDTDNNGEISFKEFKQMMSKIIS